MSGDLEKMVERARRRGALSGSVSNRNAALEAAFDRAEKRRLEKERAAREAALEAQRAGQQARRDKQLQLYEQFNTNQRAAIAADAANQEHRNQLERDKFQQKGTLKRDQLQNQFTSQRDRQQALDQQNRDERQFGYSQRENEQQFGNQLKRDALQQAYTTDRDRLQQQNTLERDAMQFGYDTRRQDQQQQNMLERDLMQFNQQRDRDQRLNEFDMQREDQQQQNILERERLQNRQQLERDQRLNQFDTERDYRQQEFTQQNMYQRETADIAARWQEQVQQARNAGLDFSPQQQKEMKELDRSFRQNVLNGPYDEGLKQRAMLEHQKKLAAIIPEEKVQHPQEGLNQSILFHEPTGSWFMQSRDSRGFPTFEPLGGGGQDQQQKMKQQAEEKMAAMKRDALFERQDRFQKVIDKLENKVDANGEPVYSSREEILNAAMNEFAPMEQNYKQEYGLPPLPVFQAEADRVRAELEKKALEAQRNPQVSQNPYRQPQIPQPVNPQQNPQPAPVQQKPLPVSSTNIDVQLKQSMESGDRETAMALQAIKLITEKNGGPPKEGTQDMADLLTAMRFLRSKGVSIEGQKKKNNPYDAKYVFPGM